MLECHQTCMLSLLLSLTDSTLAKMQQPTAVGRPFSRCLEDHLWVSDKLFKAAAGDLGG